MKQGFLPALMFLYIGTGFNLVYAGQGFTCSGFMELTEKEQIQYLEGYTLGAAMQMKYFKNNILNSHVRKALSEPIDPPNASQLEFFRAVATQGVEYVERNYALMNIAVAYKKAFFNAVVKECKLSNTQEIGMFDILPSTLYKMKETGKYPVYGM